MSAKIKIECNDIVLEAVLNEASPDKAVVITHPHPLFGGNMDNHVVIMIQKAFLSKGFTTLRFNFRGTGGSTGWFDDGKGEQEDVRAAVSFLKDEKGVKTVVLAGYSFGSRVNAALVSKGFKVEDHIMVSPPVGFMSFNDIGQMPDTGLIITGDRDDIAVLSLVRDHINRWGIAPRLEVMENCDHFYSGCLDKLTDALETYIQEKLI